MGDHATKRERWRVFGASLALAISILTAALTDWHPVAPRSPVKQPVATVEAEVEPEPKVMVPVMEKAAPAAPKKAESYQCAGTTRSGRQCKRMIRSGKYCYQHQR